MRRFGASDEPPVLKDMHEFEVPLVRGRDHELLGQLQVPHAHQHRAPVVAQLPDDLLQQGDADHIRKVVRLIKQKYLGLAHEGASKGEADEQVVVERHAAGPADGREVAVVQLVVHDVVQAHRRAGLAHVSGGNISGARGAGHVGLNGGKERAQRLQRANRHLLPDLTHVMLQRRELNPLLCVAAAAGAPGLENLKVDMSLEWLQAQVRCAHDG
mmetsp:Transcript_28230/g.72552  ORF Transcript_28230/g.72552 Transcript_28230/m.72552 type:complete len:214 (-) Transcript_28230:1800-2441(-)